MVFEQLSLPEKGSVEDNLIGLVLKNPNLRLLVNSKTVLRADHGNLNKVKIISGGGSGHEPAMCGFVGAGFLTASISGEIFAAPSSSDIFRAILELGKDHEPGILIIILNYTGDRLNFGLAIERARSYNINVEMCIVNDDCAIKNYIPSVGRRGLAGAVFINKIACALSDKGWSLKDISGFINCILEEKRIKSIGISINKNSVELGKGVHGEPGSMFLKLDTDDYSNMVNKMLNTLFEDFPKSSKHFFILINNLGGHSPSEMCTIRNEVIFQLKNEYRDHLNDGVVRIYCGTYLTSLNVKGFSVSILIGDELITKCMDHLCDTDAWKASYINLENCLYDDIFIENKYSIEIENIESAGPKLSSNGSKMVYQSLYYICEALVSCEKQLNIIDSEAGDGDTGSTIARGAAEILKLLETEALNLNYPEIFLIQISKIAEKFMGGTSGALYSIFFQAASIVFKQCSIINLASWTTALNNGIKAIQNHGHSKVGERTMLDPLHAVLNVLNNSIPNTEPEFKALELATEAAEQAALLTVNMLPQAGRAVYSRKSINTQYPDAGAHAVGIWMRALCEAIRTFTM